MSPLIPIADGDYVVYGDTAHSFEIVGPVDRVTERRFFVLRTFRSTWGGETTRRDQRNRELAWATAKTREEAAAIGKRAREVWDEYRDGVNAAQTTVYEVERKADREAVAASQAVRDRHAPAIGEARQARAHALVKRDAAVALACRVAMEASK